MKHLDVKIRSPSLFLSNCHGLRQLKIFDASMDIEAESHELAPGEEQAFKNVKVVLTAAGATFADVVSFDSFHNPIDSTALETVMRLLKEHAPQGPLMTNLGVVAFGDPRMNVEIKVVAIVADERS